MKIIRGTEKDEFETKLTDYCKDNPNSKILWETFSVNYVKQYFYRYGGEVYKPVYTVIVIEKPQKSICLGETRTTINNYGELQIEDIR